jgi:hypothetical protein
MRTVQKLPSDSQGKGDPKDKRHNGVYIRSKATSITGKKIEDPTQNWEKWRWRNYWVKYHPDRPAALIKDSDRTTLYGDFTDLATGGEYVIYQKWQYQPPTPLNVGCYNPNAMNEVYNNTFIGLTEYKRTRHGGYGDAGAWATGVLFIGMDRGPAERGKYSIYLHDNTFVSNDLFVTSYRRVTNTVRMERNTFKLQRDPTPTVGHTPFRAIGKPFEEIIKAGDNTFEGMQP